MEQPARPAVLLRCLICAFLFPACATYPVRKLNDGVHERLRRAMKVKSTSQYPYRARIFAASTPGGEPEYCTVYNHLVKSGGTSIKEQLVHSSQKEYTQRPGLCTSDGSSSITSCYQALHNSSVIMGYGEVLRHALHDHGRDCQYFTMMRHPIDQLVSAFYYCPNHDVQRRPSRWCGDEEGEAEPLTHRLISFARRHWTNMTYRQMLHSIFCQPWFELCPPELARPRTHRPHNMNTEESRETLEKIQNILLSYSAVGIFEEWDLSMELFDAKVVSSVRAWDHRVAHNPGPRSSKRETEDGSRDMPSTPLPDLNMNDLGLSNSLKSRVPGQCYEYVDELVQGVKKSTYDAGILERVWQSVLTRYNQVSGAMGGGDFEALLRWALVNPDLHDILSADLLLYNFGVLVFKHQTAKALGTVWG